MDPEVAREIRLQVVMALGEQKIVMGEGSGTGDCQPQAGHDDLRAACACLRRFYNL